MSNYRQISSPMSVTYECQALTVVSMLHDSEQACLDKVYVYMAYSTFCSNFRRCEDTKRLVKSRLKQKYRYQRGPS